MGKIKLVIFDIDGTLLDTYEYVLQSFEKTLAHHGEVLTREELEKHNGRPITDIYTELLPLEYLENVLQKHREIQGRPDMLELLHVFPKAESLLLKLQSRGSKIAALSNRMQPSLNKLLEFTGLLGYFDLVRGANELKEQKPQPGGVLQVCQELGVQHLESVMVGDTAIDIQTGENASLQAVIGVTHGFGTRQELEEAGADYVVDSLTELDELVERLGNGED